ncbi:hypothetical protein OIU77_009277 [Salix suchowensis]|uniref:Uncharacterized protein n=1 Tax=Salix suchowensis TaxID=1278906 RepID=A0ABQ9AE18_9ROSI|nr:hypothetical protein OIU77_009277 [Salix suchowensis]
MASSSCFLPSLCNPGIMEAKVESLSFSEKTNPKSLNPFSSSYSNSDRLLLVTFFRPLLVTFFLDDSRAYNFSVGVEYSSSVTSLPEKTVLSFGCLED